MCYIDIIKENEDLIVFEFMTIIDNKTMGITYSICTNFHLDYGICDSELFTHYHGTSKREYRKRLQAYKKAGNLKLKLYRTNNDEERTRIVYRLAK